MPRTINRTKRLRILLLEEEAQGLGCILCKSSLCDTPMVVRSFRKKALRIDRGSKVHFVRSATRSLGKYAASELLDSSLYRVMPVSVRGIPCHFLYWFLVR